VSNIPLGKVSSLQARVSAVAEPLLDGTRPLCLVTSIGIFQIRYLRAREQVLHFAQLRCVVQLPVPVHVLQHAAFTLHIDKLHIQLRSRFDMALELLIRPYRAV